MTWLVLAVMLFCDRDVAPIFGHLSTLAGGARGEARRPRSPRSWRSPCPAPRARTRRSRRSRRRPSRGSTQPPPAVVLRFDQTVTITTRAIEVFTADGHKVSGPAVATGGGRGVRAALSGLKRARLHRALARDVGRRAHGLGRLHLRHRRHAAASDGGVRLDRPGWTDDAARWAFFVALALLLGATGFRLLVLREPLPPRLSNRLYGISAAAGSRCSTSGSRPSCCAHRRRCGCRSSTSCTATSRRSPRRPASASRSWR